MVETRRVTAAAPDAVWQVLADGWTYPVWVVGAVRMRAVDASFPAPGATLHHSVGAWPLLLNDTTTVQSAQPGRELVLRARGRPTGEVEVHLLLEPTADGGCEVVMREDVVAGPALLVPPPLRALLIGTRNEESLRRLALLAERPSG
jgi:uncharacterized protein YndB with AHSA1/START domain